MYTWLASEGAQPFVEFLFFALSCIFIYLTMYACPFCVFLLMVASFLLSFKYRYMFLIMLACIAILWWHGWTLGSQKGLIVEWK